MRFRFVLPLLILFATPAVAQTQYTPPDAELWALMVKAFSELPISLNAHQQIQIIVTNIQREAAAREALRVKEKKE